MSDSTSVSTQIFSQEYHGFEDLVDMLEDIQYAIQTSDLDGEFQGTVQVLISYIPEKT